MAKRKPKTLYNMLLSTKLGNLNQNILVLCNKTNRDGKAIIKALENIETLKLVVFHGNKEGFIPNTVYTFKLEKQDIGHLKSPSSFST